MTNCTRIRGAGSGIRHTPEIGHAQCGIRDRDRDLDLSDPGPRTTDPRAYHSGFGLIGLTRVSATPSRTAAVPSIFRMPSGSPSRNAAPAMATSGTRLEYTDVRAEPICRTAAYQIV